MANGGCGASEKDRAEGALSIARAGLENCAWVPAESPGLVERSVSGLRQVLAGRDVIWEGGHPEARRERASLLAGG
jgi:hypothetical protein